MDDYDRYLMDEFEGWIDEIASTLRAINDDPEAFGGREYFAELTVYPESMEYVIDVIREEHRSVLVQSFWTDFDAFLKWEESL